MNFQDTVSHARHLLASNVRRLRKAWGVSQEKLALEAGLHRSYVTHVEAENRNVSLDNIERLAKALGVQVGDLFKDIDE